MKEIQNDAFYNLVKQYDSDPEHHLVGEVDYYLLDDNKPYEGLGSHREALSFVFDLLVERNTMNQKRDEERWGGDIADQLVPWTCDIDRAQAARLNPQVFFYCPNIVKTDHYGNNSYDAEWEPNDENYGTTVPYWYAVLEPIHSRKNKPEDFKIVNEALFPNGTDALDIYEWSTDWSDYFDDGHEWYGACCWSVYDKSRNRFVVMLVSATD